MLFLLIKVSINVVVTLIKVSINVVVTLIKVSINVVVTLLERDYKSLYCRHSY